MLVILSGLPGVGKTTVARLLCRRLAAFHLRVDTIEQAIVAAGGLDCDVGPVGYIVAYRVAEDNLRIGATVVADSVNPLAVTRRAWRAVAASADADALDIEVVCSDANEHRRRIETRSPDIEGQKLPQWSGVVSREYEPWSAVSLIVDTAERSAGECADEIAALVRFVRKDA